MIVHSLGSTEVGIAQPDPWEEHILQEASADYYHDVKDLDHAQALRILANAAPEIAAQTPGLQTQLGYLATHNSFKTLVLELAPPEENSLPDTPVRYLTPNENPVLQPAVTRGLLLGMMGVSPFGYTSQQSHNVINNVVAIQAQTENRVKGASANAKDMLGMHTEDASYNLTGGILPNGNVITEELDLSPDWLTIQFLRNPDGVPTLVSVPDLSRLSDQAHATLSEPRFHNATNPGQQEDGNNDSNVRLSVIHGEQFIRANTDGLTVANPEDIEARQALEELNAEIARARINLPSKPGHINFIDNNRVLHGRAEPREDQMPRWNGHDRWQQRVVNWDDPTSRREFMAGDSIVKPELFLSRVALLASA